MDDAKTIIGAILLGMLLGTAMMMAILAVAESNTQTDFGYTCQMNGYSDIIMIRDNPYCYHLSGDAGELKLLESLKQEDRKTNE